MVAISTPPTLSIAEADVGSTLVGFTSDEYFVAVINNGPTTFTPSTVTVSEQPLRHQPERGHVRARSARCLRAPTARCGSPSRPTAPGPVSATLTVAETGFGAVSVSSTVRGTGGDPTLRANPGGKDLGTVVIGQTSPEILFDVENISLAPTSVSSIEVSGANPDDFAIASNSCAGKMLNPRATCSVGVTFSPTGPGHRTALVKVVTPLGQYTTHARRWRRPLRPGLRGRRR